MSSPEPAVEVVYARPERQWLVRLPLQEGMTAMAAVEASGLLVAHRELAAQPMLLGIFGKRIEAGRRLRDGDRVEIYRPLSNDPRDARRRAVRAARPRR